AEGASQFSAAPQFPLASVQEATSRGNPTMLPRRSPSQKPTGNAAPGFSPDNAAPLSATPLEDLAQSAKCAEALRSGWSSWFRRTLPCGTRVYPQASRTELLRT